MSKREFLNRFFCGLNNLNDAGALKAHNLTKSDYTEILSLLFVDIAQSFRLSNGRKASAQTTIEPVADYYRF